MKKILSAFSITLLSVALAQAYTTFIIDGSSYTYPNTNDEQWGDYVTDFEAAQNANLNNLKANTATSTTTIKIRVDNLDSSTATLTSRLNAVGVDTTTLRTRIDNLDLSTANLTTRANNLDSSTATITGRVDALGVDTTTLKTRIDNLDSSTATLTTRANNLDSSTATLTGRLNALAIDTTSLRSTIDTSTADKATVAFVFLSTSDKATVTFVNVSSSNKAIAVDVAASTLSLSGRIDGHDLFRSTVTTRIQGYDLYFATAPERLYNAETSISTGFNCHGGSTFTTVNAQFIGDGSLLTGLPTGGAGTIGVYQDSTFKGASSSVTFTGSGITSVDYSNGMATVTVSGGSGTGYNYSTIVIATSATGLNPSANIIGTDQTPFATAISSLGAAGGTIYVRRGNYTFTAGLDVPPNVTLLFENGASITNSGNFGVISCSGCAIRGDPTFYVTGSWTGPYFLLLNSSAVVENLSLPNPSAGDLGTRTSLGKNSIIRMRGQSPRLHNFSIKNPSIGGGNHKDAYINIEYAIDAIADGIYGIGLGADDTFMCAYTTRTSVRNMNVYYSATTRYIFGDNYDNTLAKDSTNMRMIVKNLNSEIPNGVNGYTLINGETNCQGCIYNGINIRNNGGAGIGFSFYTSSATTLTNSNFYGCETGIRTETTSRDSLYHGNHIGNSSTGISSNGTGDANADNFVNGLFTK